MSLMSAKKLLMQGAQKIRPQDVFATSLYTGNGGTQTITNGLDLAGRGGLVWGKGRASGTDHILVDTVRGGSLGLSSNTSAAETARSMQFNANGFALLSGGQPNSSGIAHVAWAFRRAKKFFDVAIYTGDGTANRKIPHNLGTMPGMIVLKSRSSSGQSWVVLHRSLGWDRFMPLQTTDTPGPSFISTAPTVAEITLGSTGAYNTSGQTYVVYFFAQNPNLIDMGSYVGNGSTSGPAVVCGNGWKPQWLMTKRTDGAGDWYMLDSARSPANPLGNPLAANLASAEFSAASSYGVNFTASGFTPYGTSVNVSGGSFIYMAIRSPT